MIRLDVEEPTKEIIEELLADHDPSKFEKMQAYYEGEHDILDREMNGDEKPNNKLVNPFPTYIVNVMQGYFMGEPVTYTSENEDYMERLQEVFDENDEQNVNSINSKEASIKGKAYEILYADEEAQPNFAPEKAENVIMVYDTKIKPEPIFAIREYEIEEPGEEEPIIKVEVYTKDRIYYYKMEGDTLEEEGEEEHNFGEVPVIEYLNNDEGIGDFERVV